MVVLAETLTDEAKDFLKNKAGQKYMGIEKSIPGSKVYSSTHPDGKQSDIIDLWSFARFIDLVM